MTTWPKPPSGADRSLIIATGGHSGLGLETLRQILSSSPTAFPPPYRIILLGRNSETSQKGLEKLKALADVDSLVELREFDSLDLSVVRKVGRELAHELEHPADDQPKDVLRGMFLNAGMIAGKQRRVQDKEDKTGKADGLKDAEGFYDETLLVNHVAHLVLINSILNDRLLPQLSQPIRIVITSSGMHYGAKLNALEGILDASQPLGSWSKFASYASSKLVQALGARQLARKLEQKLESSETGPEAIEIILAHPGVVPGTQIARASTVEGFIFKALSYIPIPFILQTVSSGAVALRVALTTPLDDMKTRLPWGERKPRWTHPGARVQGAYIDTGGYLSTVSSKTDDEELAARWWPSAADEV